MKKMLNLRVAWVAVLIGFIEPAFGQSDADHSANGERDIVSSIAAYPTDLRSAVLDVAQYPQVLVKLERIQARSSQSFQDLISGYPREEQQKFYDLSRFPDLLSQFAHDGKRSTADVKPMLHDLPKETQASILDVYENHYNDLSKINYIYESSEEALQKVISDYPQSVQSNFKKVIAKPEVMNLLTENIDLTTSLGDDYRSNPNAVISQLDSLNDQQKKDLAEYKKEVESSPEMQRELSNAADSFSSTYAQNDSPVGSYLDGQPTNYSNAAPVINNYYNYNPYPYWFSYPYWYATPIWYPVPYYYNTGFYYGRGGRIVVWGFPSYAYSNWFFSFGYRHYPHLYTRYHGYYHNYYHNYYGGGRERNYGGYRGRTYDQGSRSNNHGSRTYDHSSRMSSNVQASRVSPNISHNRTFVNRGPANVTTNRNLMNSNQRATVNRDWIRSSSTGGRSATPMQQNIARPSNNRSSQQFQSRPSISIPQGGGGSRGGFSGARGGSGGGHSSSGGGGGHGGGGGRRGR